jgi:hypothetical protein
VLQYTARLLLLLTAIAPLSADVIEGTIVVKRRLSKKKVTATASVYALGVAWN